MKKSIFIISFVAIALLLISSISFAADNKVDNVKSNVTGILNNAGNAVQDTASGAGQAIQNGANAVGDAAQNAGNEMNNEANNMMNDMNNMTGDYTATRTATDNNANNTNQGFNNVWTWVVIGVIAIVVIGLIWYYVSQNNR